MSVTKVSLVRVAQIQDLSTVRRIEEESKGKLYFGLGTPEQQRVFFETGGTIFIIMADGEVIGTTSFKPEGKNAESDGKAVHIPQLAILPPYQGNGYGAQAARLLLEEVRRQGFEVAWGQIHPDNTTSLNLWKGLGFDVVDSSPDYFGDGEPRLIVEKRI